MEKPLKTAGPEAFVEDLWPGLHEAAAIARSLEGRVPNRPKEGESTDIKSALTLADTAAQEALLIPLCRRFCDVELQAEEDTESVGRFSAEREALVVIDPIDGTLRSYLNGEGPYAVIAGLALENRYQGVVLALPREDLFFQATAGGGAHVAQGDGPPTPVRAAVEGDTVMVSYDLPEPIAARIRERGWKMVEGCGGALSVAPLLPGVVGGLRVPSPGPISLRGRIGLLASEEGGARVAHASGPASADLREPLPHMAVSANERVLEDLVWALQA